MSERVLLVEDEAPVRFGISSYLSDRGIALEEAESCAAAVSAFRERRPDAAVLDHRLPDGDGIGLIAQLTAIDASVPVIVLTAHGSIDLAVQAMRAGASHFLTKPVNLQALESAVRRAIAEHRSRLTRRPGQTRRPDSPRDPFIGKSARILALREQALRVARSASPKLIQGETGAGKGVLARWLHAHGPRCEGELVDLNCASLTRDLLESELFGFERGAFTGAATAKPGLLEKASDGTLFLDEIGEMDLAIQPKILKALEEGRVRRLGAVSDREVRLHLVAATHKPLAQLAASGAFRSDLYFRVATIPLEVPPLRARREDIPVLAELMLEQLRAREGRPDLVLGPSALASLTAYDWPGNLRELRNVLECAVLLCDGAELSRSHLRFAFEARAERSDFVTGSGTDVSLADAERFHIERVLRQHDGRVEEAARALRIPRSTLYYKLKKHGIAASKI